MLITKKFTSTGRTALGILLFFFYLPLNAQPEYSQLVVFGDSLSDPGNAFVLTGEASLPPYDFIPSASYARGGHHFTNGETWVEKLAKRLHRNTGPAFRTDKAFANYAVGGARAREIGPVNMTVQVGLFLMDNGPQVANDALYTIFIGGNDLRDAVEMLAADPSMATSYAIIDSALTAIYDNMLILAASGATDFLVINGPDLSLVPAVLIQDPLIQILSKYFSNYFNTQLASKLSDLEGMFPISIKTVDIFALFNTVVAAPQAFGFEIVDQSCITPDVVKQAVCFKPDTYLFWDGIHPTRAGHQVIADTALNVINQP